MTRGKHSQNGRKKHVVLVGAMGVGKTTVGRELARRLGRPFLDSDSELEDRHGETGAEIASRAGVDRLHALELQVFRRMIDSQSRSVIAPAASVVDSDEGRSILAENLTIWLDAPEEMLSVRRSQDDHRREVGREDANELEMMRRPFWQRLAAAKVDASGSVEDVVESVLREMRRIELDHRHT